MNRREFLSRAAVLSAASGPLLRAAAPKRAAASVLLITVEDLGAWMLGVYGNKSIQTPQLDTQARTGTRLINACTAAPAPDLGRESLLHGVAPAQLGGQHPSMADIFRSHGYVAGSAASPATSLDQCTHATVDFLNRQAPGRPFFFTVNYAPLRADSVPDAYTQAYASSDFSDLGWQPASGGAASGREKLANVVNSLRFAAGAITYFDAQIPAIRNAIVQRNLYESTIVVITGSNGSLLGRHGLWGDGRATNPPNMYEEVVRVPFLCSWPGQTPADSYRVEEVSLYDVLPTLCDMAAGVPPPGGALPGRNFAKVLLNQPFPKNEPWRNLVFAELDGVAMGRDNRYKLVLHPDLSGELYDLSEDAREMTNRFDDGSYINVKNRLSSGINLWRQTFRR
ncbi:MAG TPA: sulfatase-like hydrolase/transferase [Bryobacteraceae bacterium]|nr:sulfatase-like hydrolase/transferase [Bryobacteraceae bacterium]